MNVRLMSWTILLYLMCREILRVKVEKMRVTIFEENVCNFLNFKFQQFWVKDGSIICEYNIIGMKFSPDNTYVQGNEGKSCIFGVAFLEYLHCSILTSFPCLE